MENPEEPNLLTLGTGSFVLRNTRTGQSVVSWWNRGRESSGAVRAQSFGDRFYYEIGQKTLPDNIYARFAHTADPVAQGRAMRHELPFWQWFFPSARGLVLGAGKTFWSGPTEGARFGLKWLGAGALIGRGIERGMRELKEIE